MSLPTDSAARKAAPVTTGNFRYFPDAHLAIAQLSVYGNDKHNPGQPLHWSREKSNDHADCVGRHLLEPFGIDYSYGPDKPVLHAAQAAWRALANLQVEIEELKKQGKWPLAAHGGAVPADCTPQPPMTAGVMLGVAPSPASMAGSSGTARSGRCRST